MDLLLGSANAGKVRELMVGLRGLPLRIRELNQIGELSEPQETADTYEENALLKASYYYNSTGLWTLADDSGLEVDHLNGQPGVLTARYGGVALADDQRLVYLLKQLRNVEERAARFVCVIALVGPNFAAKVRGECYGTIACQPRGDGGFGYDPIFVPDGYDRTLAELPNLVKSQISHRARALAAAKLLLDTMMIKD